MRTRKSLLVVVLLCAWVAAGLAFGQEKRWSKGSIKHRDKSVKGKFDDHDYYADRTKTAENSEELPYDRSSVTANYYGSGFLDKLAIYRNNRAIDSTRYAIPASSACPPPVIREEFLL